MALDLTDKSGNGNTLTNHGADEYTADTGFVDSTKAADLERGDSDYFTASDSASLSITGSLTVEAWIKLESLVPTDDAYCIASKWDDSGVNKKCWIFRILDSGGSKQIQFILSNDGSAQEQGAALWTPSADTWYHVAMAYNAGVPEVKYYIDGTLLGSAVALTKTSIFNSDGEFAIGVYNPAASRQNYFDGKIDEVRVHSVARDAAFMTNYFDQEVTTEPLITVDMGGYWTFEPTGTLYTATYNDTVTITDTFSGFRIFFKTFDETVNITEVFNRLVSKIYSETVTITDTFTKVFITNKTFNDVITVTDSIRKFVNNSLILIWSKVPKPTATWSKITKAVTTWTKSPKPHED